MRPILILQHEDLQGPDFLQQCLGDEGLETLVLRPDQGDRIPGELRDFAGVAVLGSDHSVHDKLSWIGAERVLLQQALAHEVPVLAHCFGAQQLALVAGAQVSRNAWPNVGWSRVWVTPEGRRLFCGAQELQVFNWHYDTFEIPRGARRLLFGAHCLNKAFALGPHLGFQCHLEVSEAGLRRWCEAGRAEVEGLRGPAVQRWGDMLRDLPARTLQLQRMARAVYHQWAWQLQGPPRRRVPAGAGA